MGHELFSIAPESKSKSNLLARIKKAYVVSSQDPLVRSHYELGGVGLGSAAVIAATAGREAGLAVSVGPAGAIICGVVFQARRMHEALHSTPSDKKKV